jgi:hypothetical protein
MSKFIVVKNYLNHEKIINIDTINLIENNGNGSVIFRNKDEPLYVSENIDSLKALLQAESVNVESPENKHGSLYNMEKDTDSLITNESFPNHGIGKSEILHYKLSTKFV